MATYVPPPDDPTVPLNAQVSIINVLIWIREALKFLAALLLPFANMDAKAGVLVGDDAKRTILSGLFPSWLQNIINKLTDISHEYQQVGTLGHTERNYRTSPPNDFYVTLYDNWRDIGFGLFSALTENVPITQPFFTVVSDTDTGRLENQITQFKDLLTADLITAKPKLLHILAALAALNSISDRVPIPIVQQQVIDKVPVVYLGSVITFKGGTADVIAAKEMEVVTRLEQYRESNIAQPGG